MMNTFVEIKLAGIEDPKVADTRKEGYIHVYGVRTSDAARRLVGIAVGKDEAKAISDAATFMGTFPTIEVPEKSWFYVGFLGPSMFEEGKQPS